MALSPGDPHSYARPEFARVVHSYLRLTVEFEENILRGTVTLYIKMQVGCDEIVLDSYKLKIYDVINCRTKQKLQFNIQYDNKFGSKFTIKFPQNKNVQNFQDGKYRFFDDYVLDIEYETHRDSPALYWLRPDQTSDGKYPFLVTNNMYTYARAVFPCQDTPSVKSTYTAQIIVPKNLKVIIPGKCAQIRTLSNGRCQYRFDRTKSMPSYMMFIVAGPLSSEKCDSESNIDLWAEEKYIQQSKVKFANIGHILRKAHKLFGSFYETFNICVLPPNIPELEIESPSMIFVSSTLLESDYSVINNTFAQKIAQVWAGGVVTCANFEHLWLNKSFSTFMSRTIIRSMFGEEMAFLLEIKGCNDLRNMKSLYGNFMQKLVPDLKGILPKDIIKYVPYESGCVLLNDLHYRFNEDTFFEYLRIYFRKFKKKSISTNNWLDHLRNYFPHYKEINWLKWLYEVDLTFLDSPAYDPMKVKCYSFAIQWVIEERYDVLSYILNTLQYDSSDLQRIEFLTYLHAWDRVLPIGKLQRLESAFPFDEQNCEIRFLFIRLYIKCKTIGIVPYALKFVEKYCAPKYACPIFRDLYEFMETRKMAISGFIAIVEKNCQMLPETMKEVASILNIELGDIYKINEACILHAKNKK